MDVSEDVQECFSVLMDKFEHVQNNIFVVLMDSLGDFMDCFLVPMDRFEHVMLCIFLVLMDILQNGDRVAAVFGEKLNQFESCSKASKYFKGESRRALDVLENEGKDREEEELERKEEERKEGGLLGCSSLAEGTRSVFQNLCRGKIFSFFLLFPLVVQPHCNFFFCEKESV